MKIYISLEMSVISLFYHKCAHKFAKMAAICSKLRQNEAVHTPTAHVTRRQKVINNFRETGQELKRFLEPATIATHNAPRT